MNKEVCVQILGEIFARADLAEWKRELATFSGVWAPVLGVKEVHDHPQIEPNGMMPRLTDNDGIGFRIVASPMSFDNQPTIPQSAAPELGQHTETILMDAGLNWDAISDYREHGALG